MGITSTRILELQRMVDHLPNFFVVGPEMCRGGQPTERGLKLLKDAGVKTVINLRNEGGMNAIEEHMVARIGLNYAFVPLSPFKTPSPEDIELFLEVARDPDLQPVFVHCLHGMDRTGTMVFIYRMETNQLSYERAYQEMLACGFHEEFENLLSLIVQYRIG